MSAEEDGFLGRWSRLKRRAAQPEPNPERDPEHDGNEKSGAELEALSDKELAALPRIEDLTEGSDIRAFLRAGIPRLLRNAALRRMWMLTPAIRDYRDPALDYAWDWNAPGGVPGDGFAPSPERTAEMLQKLLAPREDRAKAENVEDVPLHVDAEPTRVAEIDGAVPGVLDKRAVAVTDAESVLHPTPETTLRRRHGSALPN